MKILIGFILTIFGVGFVVNKLIEIESKYEVEEIFMPLDSVVIDSTSCNCIVDVRYTNKNGKFVDDRTRFAPIDVVQASMKEARCGIDTTYWLTSTHLNAKYRVYCK